MDNNSKNRICPVCGKNFGDETPNFCDNCGEIIKGRSTAEYWTKTNTERIQMMARLFSEADEILASFSREDYEKLDNEAPYTLPKCVKYGFGAVQMLKCSDFVRGERLEGEKS